MISFVILHYKNLKDTIECIESIQHLKTKEQVSIIVVDNYSLTKLEEKQLMEYTDDLILNHENLGFAKANNVGCSYAINKYHPDFLCVINNDTLILQENFIEEIKSCYQKTYFDMLGPKIITDGGESVNPFPVYKKIDEVKKAIRYHERLARIYKSGFLTFLMNGYIGFKRIFKKPRHLENGMESEFGASLHGCAIIFSRKYYEKYPTVFYEGTFLYHEEEFLAYRKRKDGLVTYYDASLEIFHKEGASLNETFKNSDRDKLVFRNQEIVRSLTLLKEVLESNKSI